MSSPSCFFLFFISYLSLSGLRRRHTASWGSVIQPRGGASYSLMGERHTASWIGVIQPHEKASYSLIGGLMGRCHTASWQGVTQHLALYRTQHIPSCRILQNRKRSYVILQRHLTDDVSHTGSCESIKVSRANAVAQPLAKESFSLLR